MSLCPARIYALCEQADFPRGERPLPVWGSKKYAAYHDYFDEWEERCATPVRTAARLANNTLVAPSSFPVQKVPSRYAGDGQRPGHTEWYFQPAIRDQAVRSRDGCLVYSFGVQHNDEFTNFWAAQGCRVFAFDPTVNHSTAPNAWHRNVTFRPWGLRSKTSASNYQTEVNKLGQYGSVFGELISLREIMTRLGHPLDSLITAFKLDCEGCEFATFEELFCESAEDDYEKKARMRKANHSSSLSMQPPGNATTTGVGSFAPRIVSISIEFHFWVAHRMQYSDDIERIRYAGLWLRRMAYKSFSYHIHNGVIMPWRGEHARVHPDLIAAGMPRHVCCYMYGFVREDLLEAFHGNGHGLAI